MYCQLSACEGNCIQLPITAVELSVENYPTTWYAYDHMKSWLKRNKKWVTTIVISMISLLLLVIVDINTPVLDYPKWHTGDWFEINISLNRNRIKNGHLWETVRKRYTILGDEEFLGHKCYVIANTLLYDKHQVSKKISIKDNVMYYISKDDFLMIGVKEIEYDNKGNKHKVVLCGIIPWRYAMNDEMVLLKFPIKSYVKFQPQLLHDINGKVIAPPDNVPYDKNESIIQSAKYEYVRFNSKEDKFIRISTKTTYADEDKLKYFFWLKKSSEYRNTAPFVYRWKPGQIWWSQAWDYYPRGGATFRASLYSTSRDGILNYPLPKIDVNDNVVE